VFNGVYFGFIMLTIHMSFDCWVSDILHFLHHYISLERNCKIINYTLFESSKGILAFK
jgi:hypothetical protein